MKYAAHILQAILPDLIFNKVPERLRLKQFGRIADSEICYNVQAWNWIWGMNVFQRSKRSASSERVFHFFLQGLSGVNYPFLEKVTVQKIRNEDMDFKRNEQILRRRTLDIVSPLLAKIVMGMWTILIVRGGQCLSEGDVSKTMCRNANYWFSETCLEM